MAVESATTTKTDGENKSQTAVGKTTPIQPKDDKSATQPADQKTDDQAKTADQAQKPDQGQDQGKNFSKVLFRVKVGNMIFDNTKGEIIGQPYIRLSTYQHSSLKCLIYDPDDQLRIKIAKQQDVQVELGFVGGPKQNVFVGKLYSVGRRPPDGTEIVAVDPSYQMQQSTGASVQFSGDPGKQPTTPEAQQGQTTTDPKTGQTTTTVTDPKTGETTTTVTDPKTGQTTTTVTDPKTGQTKTTTADSKTGQTTTTTTTTDPKTGQATTTAASQATNQTDPKTGQATTTSQTTNQTVSSETTQPKNPNEPQIGINTSKDLSSTFAEVTSAATQNKPTVPIAEQFANSHNLKFADKRQVATGSIGSVRLQQSEMQAASIQALLQGDTVVTRGNTVQQIAPGQGESSGVVLDYVQNRSAFIGKPIIFKRTGLQLQSGFGALTVQGFSVNDKQTVGATVVTPNAPGEHPTGVINAPEWGQVKLGDKIYQGSLYTWGDATRNGERVPESKEVMKGIILAARTMDEISKKYLNGQRAEINSWYRDPATNMAVSSSGANGPHTTGSAVDFYCTGMDKIHADYDKSWQGGVAISPGSFVHIDWVGHPQGLPGSPNRRWNY